MMQAIAVERFGDDPRMMDVSTPDPGVGELEVVIHAASMNPFDRAVAAGHLAGVGEYRFPLVLGFDGAGTIRRVGDQAGHFTVGDRVFGQFWSNPMQFGTHAEVSIVQAAPALGALALVPQGIGSAEAAAAPTAGMTAVGALDQVEVVEGDSVIIVGAAGGVGTFAVQAATARGLRVLAVAASNDAAGLRKLGATETLPRERAALEDALQQLQPVAAVLDFAGDQDTVAVAATAVRRGGTVISTAYGISDDVRASNGYQVVDYVLEEKAKRLHDVAKALADGTLRSVIGHQVFFENAANLDQEARRDGLRGKTVLVMR